LLFFFALSTGFDSPLVEGAVLFTAALGKTTFLAGTATFLAAIGFAGLLSVTGDISFSR
jgi:hypothetical protein